MTRATEIVLADNHRLAGAIVTRDERVALDYAAAIRVGQFSWNGAPGYWTERAPFGGFGDFWKRRKGRGGPRDPFDDIPAHLLRPLIQRAFS